MKRIYIIVIAFLLIINLNAVKNWKAYTNTTHIFDMTISENKVILATWGGLAEMNSQNLQLNKTYTINDGLVHNDIRTLEYDQQSNILYIGAKKGGINRLKNKDFLMPITSDIGLASDNLRQIIQKDNVLYVATNQGLSVFNVDPDLAFPILIKNINTENGLNNEDIFSLEISDNYLFCGSGVGIAYVHLDSLLNKENWHYLNENNSGLIGNIIHSMSIIKVEDQELMAVATNSSVWLASLPDFTEIALIDTNIVIAPEGYFPVFLDQEANLWFSIGNWDNNSLSIVGTTENYIVKVSGIIEGNSQFTFWDENNFPTGQITGFGEINQKIAVSTWGEGIFVHENNEWRNYKNNCIIANYIMDIEVDHNSKIWVSNGYFGLYPLAVGTKGISAFDGKTWENFIAESSELRSNNIVTIAVDDLNRKWFGSWNTSVSINSWLSGIGIYDEENNDWSALTTHDGLYTNLIADIDYISENEIWISTYDGGVHIMDINGNIIHKFKLNKDDANKVLDQQVVDGLCVFGTWFTGIEYWQNEGFPNNEIDEYWHQPASTDLTNGTINDIIARQTDYSTEIWIASVNGLFMYNGETWYRYGTVHKKQFLLSSNNWQPQEITQSPYDTSEFWYVEGQERLFGSKITYPTTLFVDLYNRIWIGTCDSGFTIFSPDTDTYENYYIANSSLLSNGITSFAYEPYSGRMYIGTDAGLNSVEIGLTNAFNRETKLHKTIAYPNPFNPQNGFPLTIMNSENYYMPKDGTSCRIYDLSGDLIIELSLNSYQNFTWNGKNKLEKNCSSGIYFYVVSSIDKQISHGKIILIR